MEKRIIRSCVIIFTVLVQVSFWPVIFTQDLVPVLVLSLVISWILIAGFAASFRWIIFAGVMLDIFSFATIGTNVIILAIIGYGVSFLSRRFILEHRTWGSLLIFFFIIISSVAYYLLSVIIIDWRYLLEATFWKSHLFSFLDIVQLFMTMLLAFGLVYFPMKKIENFISFYDRRAKLMK